MTKMSLSWTWSSFALLTLLGSLANNCSEVFLLPVVGFARRGHSSKKRATSRAPRVVLSSKQDAANAVQKMAELAKQKAECFRTAGAIQIDCHSLTQGTSWDQTLNEMMHPTAPAQAEIGFLETPKGKKSADGQPRYSLDQKKRIMEKLMGTIGHNLFPQEDDSSVAVFLTPLIQHHILPNLPRPITAGTDLSMDTLLWPVFGRRNIPGAVLPDGSPTLPMRWSVRAFDAGSRCLRERYQFWNKGCNDVLYGHRKDSGEGDYERHEGAQKVFFETDATFYPRVKQTLSRVKQVKNFFREEMRPYMKQKQAALVAVQQQAGGTSGTSGQQQPMLRQSGFGTLGATATDSDESSTDESPSGNDSTAEQQGRASRRSPRRRPDGKMKGMNKKKRNVKRTAVLTAALELAEDAGVGKDDEVYTLLNAAIARNQEEAVAAKRASLIAPTGRANSAASDWLRSDLKELSLCTNDELNKELLVKLLGFGEDKVEDLVASCGMPKVLLGAEKYRPRVVRTHLADIWTRPQEITEDNMPEAESWGAAAFLQTGRIHDTVYQYGLAELEEMHEKTEAFLREREPKFKEEVEVAKIRWTEFKDQLSKRWTRMAAQHTNPWWNEKLLEKLLKIEVEKEIEHEDKDEDDPDLLDVPREQEIEKTKTESSAQRGPPTSASRGRSSSYLHFFKKEVKHVVRVDRWTRTTSKAGDQKERAPGYLLHSLGADPSVVGPFVPKIFGALGFANPKLLYDEIFRTQINRNKRNLAELLQQALNAIRARNALGVRLTRTILEPAATIVKEEKFSLSIKKDMVKFLRFLLRAVDDEIQSAKEKAELPEAGTQQEQQKREAELQFLHWIKKDRLQLFLNAQNKEVPAFGPLTTKEQFDQLATQLRLDFLFGTGDTYETPAEETPFHIPAWQKPFSRIIGAEAKATEA